MFELTSNLSFGGGGGGVCVLFLNMRRINTDLLFLYSIVDER